MITTTPDALASAERLAAAKQWEQAAQLLADAQQSALVRSRRGFYLSRAGLFSEAQEIFLALAEEHPQDARWPYMAAYQLAEQGRYSQAIALYQAAVALDPDYLKAHYRLAKACEKAGQEIQAQLAASRVLQIWHESEDRAMRERDAVKMARASYLLARAQLRRDPEGAADLLRQGLEHCPRDPNFHYLLGKALRRSARPGEAIEPLRTAERIAPKAYQQLELAAALTADGQRGEAERMLQRAAKDARGWDALKAGRIALTLEIHPLALQLLQRAARSGPCRGTGTLTRALEEARAASPPGDPPTEQERPGLSATGCIVALHSDRAFGFLQDGEGVRRYFKLRRGQHLRRGAKVSFEPIDAEKGPAAGDVKQIG